MNKIQVVILCGGKGTRFLPLTKSIPKVLVEVCNKSVLEYKFDALKEIASEIILVVGYLKEKIIEKYGDNYNGIPIKYVVQEEQLGTGHALMCAASILEGKFLVLNGDDIYSKDDLMRLAKVDFGMLGKEMNLEEVSKFASLEIDSDDNLVDIIEKPETPKSNLAGIGAYSFVNDIFDFELKMSSREEYEIIDYFTFLIARGVHVKVIPTNFWLPVGNPNELKDAINLLSGGSK